MLEQKEEVKKSKKSVQSIKFMNSDEYSNEELQTLARLYDQ